MKKKKKEQLSWKDTPREYYWSDLFGVYFGVLESHILRFAKQHLVLEQ